MPQTRRKAHSRRMPRTRAMFAGLLLLGLAATIASPLAVAAPPAAKPLGCLIEPDRIADVGSQVVGLVETVSVERGQMVTKGQLLLQMRAEVEKANASVAATRAQVDSDVLAARASLLLAEQKMTRAEALVKQNFVSHQAVEQAAGELELARQKLAQVRAQKQIWVEERRVADAQLGLRSVKSPFDGVVVDRFVNIGERVEERPLVRVAVIDPLRVELMVPTAQFGSLSVGDKVTVRPELPGVESVVATVKFVDRVLDAASNSFRVRLTLPNPNNKLPAGLRCKADLPGQQAAVVPAAASAPAVAEADRKRSAPRQM
ncbi:efflux RND transporter periplasmic adaptor subunit [Piscinibacter sakaiensis]|uniref:efflux RND transporter periplasmic adaptor subunit n=1 Tax=Piscinibacter sakaiensis TaxID=1547922 RepID=UPI003AAD286B